MGNQARQLTVPDHEELRVYFQLDEKPLEGLNQGKNNRVYILQRLLLQLHRFYRRVVPSY